MRCRYHLHLPEVHGAARIHQSPSSNRYGRCHKLDRPSPLKFEEKSEKKSGNYVNGLEKLMVHLNGIGNEKATKSNGVLIHRKHLPAIRCVPFQAKPTNQQLWKCDLLFHVGSNSYPILH